MYVELFQRGLFNQTNYHSLSTSVRTARLSGDPTYHVNVIIQQGSHDPERATPTLGLCHGVLRTGLFLDTF